MHDAGFVFVSKVQICFTLASGSKLCIIVDTHRAEKAERKSD